MSIIKYLLSIFDRSSKETIYKVYRVPEIPINVKGDAIYLIGNANEIWEAAMKCPCGCGDVIQINFDKTAKHHWFITSVKKSKISIKPSIWRTEHCMSHFSIRESRVHWYGRK